VGIGFWWGLRKKPDSRSDWNLASEEGDDSNKALRGRVVSKAGWIYVEVFLFCFCPADVVFFEASRR
jgi:hypothetical protein